MFCPKCGIETPNDSEYCSKCGTNLGVIRGRVAAGAIQDAGFERIPKNESSSNQGYDSIASKQSIEPQESGSQETHPWRRYFARGFDLNLTAFPILLGLSILIPFKPHSQATIKSDLESYGYLLGLISLPIWLIIESWMIANFKTTPGKWIWGIFIEDEKGNELSFSSAIGRSLSVWGSGMYLGIPGFNFIAAIVNYYRLERDKITHWDKKGNIRCLHYEITLFKGFLILVGFIAFGILRNLDKIQ